MSTLSARANCALAYSAATRTTRPLLTVSSCEIGCSAGIDRSPTSVASVAVGPNVAPSVVDVAIIGGSRWPGWHTFGSMIHRAEQSIPSASTNVSWPPLRSRVTARMTGTVAATPGTWRAVSMTAGSMPPRVAAPTMRSGAGTGNPVTDVVDSGAHAGGFDQHGDDDGHPAAERQRGQQRPQRVPADSAEIDDPHNAQRRG